MILTSKQFEELSDSFSTDWSSLLSQVLESLGKAEDELRLVHMSDLRRVSAHRHIVEASKKLKRLEVWCE